MSIQETQGSITPLYNVEDKPPLKEAIPLGLQHVLAMFAGNVTAPLIICGALGLPLEQTTFIVSCCILAAGIGSFVQAQGIWTIGGKLPIVMGTSFAFISPAISIGQSLGLGALFGAMFVGGLFETVLGFFLKTIRKYFPPVVTGVVVLIIGLSLLPNGMTDFAGGFGAKDFGSYTNLLLGSIVLITVVCVQAWGKGTLGAAAVIVGLTVGYIIAIFLGMVNFTPVAQAAWFSIPKPLSFGMEFHLQPIIVMCIIYIVSAVETIGDISGITMGGAGREATDKELCGGIQADGLNSSISALFNGFSLSSYSQNVGLVSMTGVMSRHIVKISALFLILFGLSPKIATIFAVMPPPVFGGAVLPMFAFIATSGIGLIASEGLSRRNVLIAAISLGLGLGAGQVPDALAKMPEFVQLIVGDSGLVLATLVGVVLNIVLPKDKAVSAKQ